MENGGRGEQFGLHKFNRKTKPSTVRTGSWREGRGRLFFGEIRGKGANKNLGGEGGTRVFCQKVGVFLSQ